jgi:high-affinity Fe2+/Pb2+ permease
LGEWSYKSLLQVSDDGVLALIEVYFWTLSIVWCTKTQKKKKKKKKKNYKKKKNPKKQNTKPKKTNQ